MDLSLIPKDDLAYVKANNDIVEILCNTAPIELISAPIWLSTIICETEQPDGMPSHWINKAVTSTNIDEDLSPLKVANIFQAIFSLAIATAQQLQVPPQVLFIAFKEVMDANARQQ